MLMQTTVPSRAQTVTSSPASNHEDPAEVWSAPSIPLDPELWTFPDTVDQTQNTLYPANLPQGSSGAILPPITQDFNDWNADLGTLGNLEPLDLQDFWFQFGPGEVGTLSNVSDLQAQGGFPFR